MKLGSFKGPESVKRIQAATLPMTLPHFEYISRFPGDRSDENQAAKLIFA